MQRYFHNINIVFQIVKPASTETNRSHENSIKSRPRDSERNNSTNRNKKSLNIRSQNYSSNKPFDKKYNNRSLVKTRKSLDLETKTTETDSENFHNLHIKKLSV